MSVLFPREAYEVMVDSCRRMFPEEACGILLGLLDGEERRVLSVHPTTNIRHSSSSYLIDPEEQYRIFMLAEERSHEVLGFYHSHPYWRATPSTTDADSALYPGFVYIIFSVPENQAKAFLFQNGSFQEKNLTIVP